MKDRAEYYRFLAPLFTTTEDDHGLTLTCQVCDLSFPYSAHAQPSDIQADTDDHARREHPELYAKTLSGRLSTPSAPPRTPA